MATPGIGEIIGKNPFMPMDPSTSARVEVEMSVSPEAANDFFQNKPVYPCIMTLRDRVGLKIESPEDVKRGCQEARISGYLVENETELPAELTFKRRDRRTRLLGRLPFGKDEVPVAVRGSVVVPSVFFAEDHRA